MQAVREYILHIVAVSILCSIILKMIRGTKTVQQIVKTICGIVISVTVISPILDISLKNFPTALLDITNDGKSIAMQAQNESDEQIHSVIRQNTEAYIISKASMFDCDLDICVTLDDTNGLIPSSVEVTGDISPYAKHKLAEIIERDVGIPKEQQVWN